MNKNLTQAITKHIFASLLIVPCDFINYDRSKSLNSKEYLLDKKITFKEEGVYYQNNLWGCQISTSEQGIKLILANCATGSYNEEYCLIVAVNNLPVYGLYLASDKIEDNYSLISVSADNGKNWMPCKTFLQATFLAGMEQIREVALNWERCADYEKEFEMIKSFLSHRESLSEVSYEG